MPATAAIGVYIVSVAVVGYFTRPLGVGLRVVFGIAGLAAVFPDTAVGASGLVDIVGIALSAVILGREYLASRAPPTATVTNAGTTT